MEFEFIDGETTVERAIDVNYLVIAGWAGRDKAALEHHIAELERAGIPRPTVTP